MLHPLRGSPVPPRTFHSLYIHSCFARSVCCKEAKHVMKWCGGCLCSFFTPPPFASKMHSLPPHHLVCFCSSAAQPPHHFIPKVYKVQRSSFSFSFFLCCPIFDWKKAAKTNLHTISFRRCIRLCSKAAKKRYGVNEMVRGCIA